MTYVDGKSVINIQYKGLPPAKPGTNDAEPKKPNGADLPKLTITTGGTTYDLGSIEQISMSPRGKFAIRLRTLNNDIVVIKGRIKSGDIKPEDAAAQQKLIEQKQDEADKVVAEAEGNDEEYPEVVREAATIHLNAIEVSGSATELMKPENKPEVNAAIADGSVRVLKRADHFRHSKHFQYLRSSGLEGSRLASKIDDRMVAVAQKLASKMQELGMKADPFITNLAGKTESTDGAASLNKSEESESPLTSSQVYDNSSENLELVLNFLKERKEHAEKVKKALAETKEEIKDAEKLIDKKRFETKCADMLALIKQISLTSDPEKAAKLLQTLILNLDSALKQLAENRADLPLKTVTTIETLLNKIKQQIKSLTPQTDTTN